MPARRKRPLRRLLCLSAAVVIIWGYVLPWLSVQPVHRRYRERLEERGIDPAATYYTDLPKDLFLDYLPEYQTPRSH